MKTIEFQTRDSSLAIVIDGSFSIAVRQNPDYDAGDWYEITLDGADWVPAAMPSLFEDVARFNANSRGLSVFDVMSTAHKIAKNLAA